MSRRVFRLVLGHHLEQFKAQLRLEDRRRCRQQGSGGTTLVVIGDGSLEHVVVTNLPRT